MRNFHDISFPIFLAIYAKCSPSFATSIAQSASGQELRVADRMRALHKYSLQSARLSRAQFEEFCAFFYLNFGRKYAFRLRDYADYIIKDQLIAIGNGASSQFEIYKIYSKSSFEYKRRIIKLSKQNLIIERNGQPIDSNMVDCDNGIITLSSPLAAGESLTARNIIFDVAVRFASDNFSYSYCHDDSITIDNLEMIEVV